MIRRILWAALFVVTAQVSWGASSTINEIVELLATDEKSPGGPGVQEAGSKIAQLSDSQRQDLIVAGLQSNSRAVRYQVAEMVNSEESVKHLDLLVRIAENDVDADVRDSALARVSSVDKIRALALSRNLKSDKDARVRFSALTGLVLSLEPDDSRAVESALSGDHLLVRIGLTHVQAINGKPLDRKIALEGLGVDVEWFKKNPLTSTGYLSRRLSHERYAQYIVSIIRRNAIDILRMAGTPEDIPFLERAAAKEMTAYDKERRFDIQALGAAERIRLRSMPESGRLEYLKSKIRDSRVWMRHWAAENLCGVPGGAEFLKSIAINPDDPAYKLARSYEKRCSWHGTAR